MLPWRWKKGKLSAKKIKQLGPLISDVKTTFCTYDRKSINVDNDGCNHDYDSEGSIKKIPKGGVLAG